MASSGDLNAETLSPQHQQHPQYQQQQQSQQQQSQQHLQQYQQQSQQHLQQYQQPSQQHLQQYQQQQSQRSLQQQYQQQPSYQHSSSYQQVRQWNGPAVETTTSVVARGAEKVIDVKTYTDESRTQIIGERVVERSVRIPKRIVYEDVVEKHIVVPEVHRREEIIDELQVIKEKIIEVAKPIIREKIVEVPDYVYVDKAVEVPSVVVEERIREVPKVEIQERVHEVPVVVTQEKIVEVPEREYRQYVVEKVVEVPEIHEKIIMKEVPVPRYVEKMIPNYVEKECLFDVHRSIPIPVEVESTFEYHIPRYKSRVNVVSYPVYLPRFVEVPVPEEVFTPELMRQIQAASAQVTVLGSTAEAVSLCEVENIATTLHALDIGGNVAARAATSTFLTSLKESWSSGAVKIVHNSSRGKRHTNFGARKRSQSAGA